MCKVWQTQHCEEVCLDPVRIVTRDTLRSSDEITAARLQEQESPSSGLQQREYEALNVDSVARKLAGGAPTAAAQFKTKLFIFEDTTKLDIIYEIRLRSICMRSHGYEDKPGLFFILDV